MVDVVISIAAKVAELMVVPVGKHICYPFKYISNMDALKKQVEKLKGVREMLQHSVDEATTQGDEIEQVVENWLTKVDEFTEGVVKPVIDDQDKVGKLCSIGFCPNLMARYSLSKKAAKTAKEVIDLWREGKFDKVSYRPLLRKTISTYIRDDYEDFESRKQIFQEIMQALKDDNSKMIGVYGMGGVGKTTLVKRVVAKAIEDKLFDFEIMVDITETPDIKKIQEQIADHLGLKFHEESLSTRAVRLRDRLKKEKKVLIVLDNIWAKLDLEAVGIPFGQEEKKESSSLQDEDLKGRNDDQRRCKILLTSRSEVVLSNYMNAEKNFLVEILSKEEAGNLFWKIVGDAAKNCDFDPIGVEIIQYCAGLPVVIATIASALKKKSLFDWKDALDQLRRSNPRHIKGMDANVYPAIKLSYDFLESEEAKSLFLLCSLVNASTDIVFDHLLRICMGWGLFHNVSTLEQGRNRLHMLINHLKASCLLLDIASSEGDVKMHDIIHAVAISIAFTDKLMFNIQDVTNLKEMLEEKLPKDSTAISLLYKDVSMLPERLAYPKLQLFFLFMEEFSLQIPDTFFEGLEELKVLEMINIHMLSLPSSLSKLTNLQTLCLGNCQVRNVAIIGELKRLEILGFWGSDIEQLPAQIKQLTRLRLLELYNCSKLKVISPNVLSCLTQLEELYMINSFFQWEVEGQSNASLSELKQLSGLTTLEIHVRDAQIMPQDLLIFEKLERYKILIGDVWEWSRDYEASRMLKLKLNNNIDLRNGIKILLSRTEYLYLDELKGVKDVLYQLNGEGFPQLKHLHVQNGSEIQYIVNSIRWGQCNVFPMLQSLFLHNLINLEKICYGQLATESFNKLKIMEIGRCDGLKHLFSFSIARNLLQLQEIKVTNCKKLEEIVFKESHEQFQQNDSVSKIKFTQLRTLSLQRLPQLTSFCFKESTPYAGSEEIFAENFVPSFSQIVLLPSLEKLKLSSINIECMWLDQLPAISSCCQTLTSLLVEECSGNLKFLFSYSMVKSLVQLETLEIRNCKSIEGIINTDELREEGKMIKMVFAKLIKLQLKGLPNLTQFGSGNSVEFHSLIQLSIEDCPKLKTFSHALASADIKQGNEIEQMNCQYDIHPLFGETVVLPTLGSMNLSSIRVQTIWHNQLQPISSSFQNLTEIVMDGCDTLKYVYSSSVVESLIQLKNLEISNCKFMEAVIITQGERTSNTLFPKLYRLRLKHLPKLTSFCNFEGKSIELPSLTELWLENCPKMQAFVSNSPDADIPTNKEEQVNSEQSQHANIQPLFDEKVRIPDLKFLQIKQMNMKKLWHHDHLTLDSFSKIDSFEVGFPSLEKMVISGMDNLESIWHNQFLGDSFYKLKSVEVNDCQEVKTIFPTCIRGRLLSLESLTVKSCGLVEEIFDLQGLNLKEKHSIEITTQLRELYVDHMSKLKHIWNEDPKGMLSYQKLQKVTVFLCPNLENLFPASVAKSLLNLVSLDVSDCGLLEEIIAKGGVKEAADRLLFPKLSSLQLHNLPQLRTFYTGQTVEVSCLKRLCLHHCDKVKLFVSEFLGFYETIELEELQLSGKAITVEWPNQVPGHVFRSLKSLELNDHESTVLPLDFIQRFGRLEKLSLNSSSYKEIFSHGELNERPQIKHLVLSGLFDLKQIWKEDSKIDLNFQKLEILEVQSCFNLNNLMPSSASFKNLMILEVWGCEGLKNLLTSSTAKSLVLLEKLEVFDCKMLIEVVANEGAVTEEINFKNLKSLSLSYLQSLASFCSMKHILNFPILESLVVNECPKMKIFSEGVTSTPKLHKLELNWEAFEQSWEVGVNTTIKQNREKR